MGMVHLVIVLVNNTDLNTILYQYGLNNITLVSQEVMLAVDELWLPVLDES